MSEDSSELYAAVIASACDDLADEIGLAIAAILDDLGPSVAADMLIMARMGLRKLSSDVSQARTIR